MKTNIIEKLKEHGITVYKGSVSSHRHSTEEVERVTSFRFSVNGLAGNYTIIKSYGLKSHEEVIIPPLDLKAQVLSLLSKLLDEYPQRKYNIVASQSGSGFQKGESMGTFSTPKEAIACAVEYNIMPDVMVHGVLYKVTAIRLAENFHLIREPEES